MFLTDSYNITNSKGRVAKVVLFKQAYKLGEDIVGLFDFSGSSVPCVQVRNSIHFYLRSLKYSICTLLCC